MALVSCALDVACTVPGAAVLAFPFRIAVTCAFCVPVGVWDAIATVVCIRAVAAVALRITGSTVYRTVVS